MRLPSAQRLIIDEAKVRDYLLSETHPVGRFKAAFFLGLGYSAERWDSLRDDLLALARGGDAVPGRPSPFGRALLVDGILTTPSGRSVAVRTVRIARPAEDVPRFITAYPR